MATVIRVPMTPVPPGATAADRQRLFDEWLARHQAANPPTWFDRLTSMWQRPSLMRKVP